MENRKVKAPLLPLRGVSVFPGMLVNFDVERKFSVAALNKALSENQLIFLVAQKDIATDIPDADDIYEVGTVCSIRQMLRIPGTGSVKVLVEGKYRARLREITEYMPHFTAVVEEVAEAPPPRATKRGELLLRRAMGLFEEYAAVSNIVTPEMLLGVIDCDEPGALADYIAQNIFLRHQEKQQVLEELRPAKRLELVIRLMSRELELMELDQRINEETKQQLDKSQRDYYLHEQLRTIRRELGEYSDEGPEELDEYRRKITGLGLPPDSEEKLLKELGRLTKQPYGSSEAAVLRTYLDTCIELPWNRRTRDMTNIDRAQKCLDEDHYGLTKVKERIIEFLAVKQLAPDIKGSVLCLVGPPGVGKTSVAMSIARATNRKCARISLGGVHDEAEIRGHRKTYVGAMPGRIIAGLQQAKSLNPVMVLDEIDKLASDYKGDPASALLEALDGEQNYAFRDNYLEIPIDLSDVFFITTANTTDTIPRPLLDRMEVIELTSYTDEEKLHIAKDHLLPKQRKRHGLKASNLKISDDAMREIISDYTKESGVRILEREIAAVCRRCAKMIASGEKKSVTVRAGALEPLLGSAKYSRDKVYKQDEVGLVRGLAWTRVGGEVLDVEAGVMDGSGKIELTGNLGDVMKESARAAISYIRTRTAELGIDPEFYKTKDIHIHFPEGAVPKDGPSAGITICVALVSALTGTPARRDVAMTGEISLRGRVMAIGGLKEKTMAALRAGINTVIIPSENEKDLQDIDQDVRAALNFVTTDHVDKIMGLALSRPCEAQQSERPVMPGALPIPEKGERTALNIKQ